jgi:hypothetical protein
MVYIYLNGPYFDFVSLKLMSNFKALVGP